MKKNQEIKFNKYISRKKTRKKNHGKGLDNNFISSN